MKFFRSHSHDQLGGGGGGVIVPAATDHPSAMLVVDAHGHNGAAYYGGEHRQDDEPSYGVVAPPDASLRNGERHRQRRPSSPGSGAPSSPAAQSVGWLAVGPGSGDPASAGTGGGGPAKRALHLEEREDRDDGAVEEIVPPAGDAPDPRSRPRSRLKFRLGRRSRVDRKASGGCSSSSEDEESDSGTRPSRMAGLRIRKARRSSSLETPSKAPVDVDGRAADRLSSSERTSRSSRRAAARADRLGSSERLPRPAAGREERPGARRRVTFARVSIREYSTVLGDHPCCPSGPPLSLGWTLEREEYSVELERYEIQRAPRRRKEEMRLGDGVRRDILRGLVVAAASSPPEEGAADDNGSGDSSAEEGHAPPAAAAVYSQLELRRAERRLTRERSANSRAHRRMNRRFFQPMAPGENGVGLVVAARAVPADAVVVGANDAAAEDGAGRSPTVPEGMEGCARMDISPVKPPVVAVVHEDDMLEGDALSP